MKRTPLKPGKPLQRGKPKRKKKSKLQKRKDKPSSKYWLKKADVVWAKLVRQKNGGYCLMCACQAIHAHHIIPRGLKAHRHNLMNGLPLCGRCHAFDNNKSPHQNPLGFLEWLRDYNPELYEWADRHRHDTCPYPDYKERYEALQEPTP